MRQQRGLWSRPSTKSDGCAHVRREPLQPSNSSTPNSCDRGLAARRTSVVVPCMCRLPRLRWSAFLGMERKTDLEDTGMSCSCVTAALAPIRAGRGDIFRGLGAKLQVRRPLLASATSAKGNMLRKPKGSQIPNPNSDASAGLPKL